MMLGIVSWDDRRDLPRIGLLDMNVSFSIQHTTIWDVFLDGNIEMLDLVKKEMRLVNTRHFSLYPTYGNIRFMGVTGAIYPNDIPTPMEGEDFVPPFKKVLEVPDGNDSIDDFILADILDSSADSELSGDSVSTHIGNEMGHISDVDGFGIDTVLGPLGFNPSLSGSYVLSEAFYNGDMENMYPLERLAHYLLERKTVNVPTLLLLARSVPKWTAMQRFYHIPILLMLIKEVMARPDVDMTDLSERLLVPPKIELGIRPHTHEIEEVIMLPEELEALRFTELDGGTF